MRDKLLIFKKTMMVSESFDSMPPFSVFLLFVMPLSHSIFLLLILLNRRHSAI